MALLMNSLLFLLQSHVPCSQQDEQQPILAHKEDPSV